jgi:hypothetical protein
MKTILPTCFLSLLFFFLVSPLVAQIPGYMGKRMTVSATLNSNVAIGGPTAANLGLGAGAGGPDIYGDGEGGFALNLRWGGEVAYVSSRRHQFSIGVSYFRTGMIADYQTPSAIPSIDREIFWADDHELFHQLDVVQPRIGFRWFNLNKGAIAPFGPYLGVNLRAAIVSQKVLDKRTNYYDAEAQGHPSIGLPANNTLLFGGFEFGMNHIIADRLVMGLSGEISIPLSLVSNPNSTGFSVSEVSGDPAVYESENEQSFRFHVAERLALQSIMMIRLSVGYLIF